MRLKYAITIGDPKSAQIVAIQARSTGESHLNREDIVTSLGLTQARSRAGLSLIYAKYTKDRFSAESALAELQRYAASITDKYFPSKKPEGFCAAVSVISILALEEYCRTADTPGAKCRCGGKGEVRDLKSSRMKGRPIQMPCPRCHGTGLKPLTRSRCHHAILKHCSVSQSTFSRYWNPFYDDLLNWCLQQESNAEASYNWITSLNPLTLESSG
ncbi:antitermination protein Q [Enterobacter sp. Lyrl_3]|uniref:antitermination protein Q n=1 Tax=Enterobacter sp. Lyrl_3 TaxID=3110922 RepID=UPI003F7F7968